MLIFDVDESGVLEFNEFVEMICLSAEFKLPLGPAVRLKVLRHDIEQSCRRLEIENNDLKTYIRNNLTPRGEPGSPASPHRSPHRSRTPSASSYLDSMLSEAVEGAAQLAGFAPRRSITPGPRRPTADSGGPDDNSRFIQRNLELKELASKATRQCEELTRENRRLKELAETRAQETRRLKSENEELKQQLSWTNEGGHLAHRLNDVVQNIGFLRALGETQRLARDLRNDKEGLAAEVQRLRRGVKEVSVLSDSLVDLLDLREEERIENSSAGSRTSRTNTLDVSEWDIPEAPALTRVSSEDETAMTKQQLVRDARGKLLESYLQ